MTKARTLSLGVLTLAALFLNGCGTKNDSASNNEAHQSFIKLQAEDAGLIKTCTEVAEYRLLSYYPQLTFDAEYAEQGVSVISFDCPENWDDRVLEQICRYGKLTFVKGAETETDDNGTIVPKGEIILENNDISNATATMMSDESGQNFAVTLALNDAGRDKFAAATEELAGTDTPISIWFDGELISSPTVQFPITDGQAMITGDFTLDSASDIANAIDSGALPCGLSVIDHKITLPQETE